MNELIYNLIVNQNDQYKLRSLQHEQIIKRAGDRMTL